MSETPQIYALISRVMADIGAVTKDRKNEQQRYSFRGIEDFYQAAHPALIAHGVFCAPEVKERTEYRFEKANDRGGHTTWLHVAMRVEHKFYAPDGSFVPVTTWGEGLDNSDKASNKAMSGAMKYALIELFCVPTKDIEDSDRTTPEQGVRRAATARTTADIPIPAPAHKAQPVTTQKGDGQGAAVAETAKVGPEAVPLPKLPPVEELAAQAEAAMKPKPATLPEGAIEPGQAVNFARSFKDALRKEIQKNATALEHEWLQKQGIVDGNGNGTAKAILKANYYDVREAAETHAKSL